MSNSRKCEVPPVLPETLVQGPTLSAATTISFLKEHRPGFADVIEQLGEEHGEAVLAYLHGSDERPRKLSPDELVEAFRHSYRGTFATWASVRDYVFERYCIEILEAVDAYEAGVVDDADLASDPEFVRFTRDDWKFVRSGPHRPIHVFWPYRPGGR